ncbi:uncharacterized protein LOC134455057 [Engraulis encrasicolus]|uniref:uncharacterized protein LOC134455057 n=1 Tax=Engraulis encrasicolus TaxID=184585 RepID=UPI002FD20FED
MTTIELIERRANKHLRRWLGIPPSFSSVGLYIRSGQLQLPLSSVVEEYKVAKCRVVLSLRDSNDDLISQAGMTTRSGRKWAANVAVDQAVSSLKLRDIVGNQCIHRQGLGSAQFQTWGGSQGAWTKWDLPRRKVPWRELWRLEPYHISFLLRYVYDTLPSPVHLHTWSLREDPLCKLCGKRGTLAHILSGCKTSLTQGRYRWRHDKVLLSLADTIERERVKKRPANTTARRAITFVKEGTGPSQTTKRKRTSILQAASSWEMRVDVGRRLQFPEVVQTSLLPDIVLWSSKDQKIILVELTVPWEEGCEEAHERKAAKYQQLAQDCRDRGWQAWVFPVEIGCRGFPARSAWSFLSAIGMDEHSKKQAARRMGEEAERASCWIWSKREEESWKPGADGQ